MDLTKVAIIGYGVVGKALHSWFRHAKIYSRSKFNDWSNVKDCDLFFICLPTPYVKGKQYDLSAIDKVISRIEDGKIIVLKSTINPGTTDLLQKKYPNKVLMFNPEFLSELTAEQDFKNPDVQIIGVQKQWLDFAYAVLDLLPKAPITRIILPVEAEWVKKAKNAFYAVKVIFFNELFDMVNNQDYYETIRSILVKDPAIGDSHSIIYHKNYRGFAGKCLPKDLYALIEFAQKKGIDPKLLKVVKEININLLKKQNIFPNLYD